MLASALWEEVDHRHRLSRDGERPFQAIRPHGSSAYLQVLVTSTFRSVGALQQGWEKILMTQG